jgi:hypothetical protein
MTEFVAGQPPTSVDRLLHVQEFYSTLARLSSQVHGARQLADCTGKMSWPRRGVYFFLEPGEQRSNSGIGPRVVRIGTHALTSGSNTKLWTRLSQHRGRWSRAGGNHRGSIFRLLVGAALLHKSGDHSITWGNKSAASREVRDREVALEAAVSGVVGSMSLLWLAIDDEPGTASLRGYVERNSIALLSNFGKPTLDPPAKEWLGHYCDRERVKKSGLWNQNHVDDAYDPAFLATFDQLVTSVSDKS